MKRIFNLLPLLIVGAFLFISSITPIEKVSYKCMVQLKNYSGEGAYVVISLLNPEGAYEETLYVQGTDSEWYSEIKEWWQFYGKRRPNIDAISGATISGGERAIYMLQIPKEKIDQGYSIKFETAVEDQEYYASDLEFELTTAHLLGKKDGSGFIRYVRLMPQ
jgi:hypothetical protein